jgi:replication factor C subunit 2/4
MNSETFNKDRYDQLPWIEKYRPKHIDEMILNNTLKYKMEQFVAKKNIPNLIFTGPSGIGKTSTIRCLARALFGKFASRVVLELNASDDRGIKSMQECIISFCKAKSPIKQEEHKNYANFKLIILDEADNMVERAQPQINSIMEQYKNTVRFAFTCNSSSNIIEAIQSRCLILRYSRLTNDLMIKKIVDISKVEKIKYNNDALTQICLLSRGDMRTALNMLQLIHHNKEKVTVEYVHELCDFPQQVIIKKMFDSVLQKKLHSAFEVLYELKNNGYSGSDITLGMIFTIKSDISNDIPEATKIKMFNAICMAAYRISKGIDSMLQLASCLVDMINVLK